MLRIFFYSSPINNKYARWLDSYVLGEYLYRDSEDIDVDFLNTLNKLCYIPMAKKNR